MITALFEAIWVLIETIVRMILSLLLVMFSVSDVVDSAKMDFIAAVLGVSSGVVSFVFLIIGAIHFVRRRFK